MKTAEAPTQTSIDLHACFHAAQRALGEHDDFCHACAERVMIAAAFLQRSSLRNESTGRACAKICDELARKCDQDAARSEHCRLCAEACRACAEACRRMATSPQPSNRIAA